MAAWKILLTDGLEKSGQEILRTMGEVDDRSGIAADELLQVVGEYDALIVRGRTKVTPAVFDAATKLKVVGRAGVGVDNINLDAAKAHGVTVVNSPLATTVAVAELAMGMMLALVREIPRADSTMKEGKWLKKEFEGGELYKKTLGVIGYGRIGCAVAERARAFGMRIVAFDPLLSSEEIERRGAEPQTLEGLCAQADVITLHLPLTHDSKDLLDVSVFDKMKDGVYIVDAARGGVLNEDALMAALQSGKVRGAALDVFVTEPTANLELEKHPRVIATPHIGAQTQEAQERAAVDIANEVLAALKGDTLRWKVA